VPPLDALESVVQQQHDAVSRHTTFLNDLHARCDALQAAAAACRTGLPIVLQLLQVQILSHLNTPHVEHLQQALESGREARARAQHQAEVAAARAAERRQALPPVPKLDEFIRLTQLLRYILRCFAVVV
jgi:hypothetical protein